LDRFVASALALVFLVGIPAELSAQSQTPSQPYLSNPVGYAGVGHYRQGAWGLVRSAITNPTAQPADVAVAVSFDRSPMIQFIRPTRLPPQSRRVVFLPLRPTDVPAGARSVEVTSLLTETTDSIETQLDREPGTLRIETSTPTSGMLSQAGAEDDFAIDASIAMRQSVGLGSRHAYLNSESMPLLAAGYDALDTLTISADTPALDSAQMAALRQWLIGGGKLWVMAEQVDPQFMRRLLGDDWTIDTIDKLPMTRFTIASEQHELDREFEKPVTMARVVHSDMEVLMEVRGWPAALRKSFGLGQILVTTVGPRAWYTERPEDELKRLRERRDHQRGRGGGGVEGGRVDDRIVETDPIQSLGRWFCRPAAEVAIDRAELTDYSRTLIGMSVLPRTPVALLLLVVAGLIVAAGVVLHRRGRLEYAAATATVLCIVVGLVMVFVGVAKRRSIPLTMAGVQFVQVAPQQQHGVVLGALTVYSPAEDKGPLKATKGGVVWPDTQHQQGEMLRMVWTDFDRWTWDNLKLPSGANLATTFRHVAALSEPVSVEVTLDETGIVGQLETGPLGELDDILLAGPSGNLAPRRPAGQPDTLVATPDDSLAPGQFIRAAVLSDVQVRRRRLLQRLLEETPGYPDQLTLLAWSSLIELGFTLPQDFVHRDATLVAIPVSLRRPPAGANVTIPGELLSFELARGDGLPASATAFDPNTLEWIPMNSGQTIAIRFLLPPEFRDLDVTGATLDLRIRAPSFDVSVGTWNQKTRKVTEVQATSSPLDRMIVSLPQSPDLQIDDAGGIVVVLDVKSPPGRSRFDEANVWQIRGVSLEVQGVAR